MKTIRRICVIVLIVICVLGWVATLGSMASQRSAYAACMAQGDENASRGLYQKAVENYREALSIQESGQARQKLLEVTRSGFEESVIDRDTYVDVLEQSCEADPDNESYWEELLATLCADQDYSGVRAVLKKANEAGVTTSRITELADQANYAYTTQGRHFTHVYFAPNGYAVVRQNDNWGMMRPDGEMQYDCNYLYVGPYGEEWMTLLRSDSRQCIADRNGLIQANLSMEQTLSARGCGSGRMPLNDGAGWRYFDVKQGEMVGETYEEASSFQNGRALVYSGGVWNFLTPEGEQTATGFGNVKLYADGGYCFDDRMVAEENGYGLYTAEGERLGEVSATDMDLYMGDAVAYQDVGGKWGFLDRNGNIVIEPTYDGAKSFSNGLAAVLDGTAWGFINSQGRWVIPAQFDDGGYFTANGVCMVSDGGDEYHTITLRFP